MMKLQLLQKGILRYMTSFNVLKNNMEELALTKMLEILPNVIDKSTTLLINQQKTKHLL